MARPSTRSSTTRWPGSWPTRARSAPRTSTAPRPPSRESASVLGRDEDAARYARIAERVRSAWRAAYLNGDGTTVADTQASYVRALSFGLVPDEMRDAAAARLVELIRSADTHLRTGFLSTADLLPVLADTGHADVAYELLFQRTAPSWLNMIDRGATTIWEDWEGIDEFGAAHESLNHYSKGAVIRFLHTHTLGLRQAPGSVAWESIVIEPVPGPIAALGTRLARDPSGNHPGGVAQRGQRHPHLRRASRQRHPPASCSPTAPSPPPAPARFHGQRSLPHPSPALTPAN